MGRLWTRKREKARKTHGGLPPTLTSGTRLRWLKAGQNRQDELRIEYISKMCQAFVRTGALREKIQREFTPALVPVTGKSRATRRRYRFGTYALAKIWAETLTKKWMHWLLEKKKTNFPCVLFKSMVRSRLLIAEEQLADPGMPGREDTPKKKGRRRNRAELHRAPRICARRKPAVSTSSTTTPMFGICAL